MSGGSVNGGSVNGGSVNGGVSAYRCPDCGVREKIDFEPLGPRDSG